MRIEENMTRVCRIAMMLALPLAFVACAPEEQDELETPDATVPEAGLEEEAAAPFTVDIEGDDVEGMETEVEGEATITRLADSLMVTLSVENLPGEGPFQAHIHAGTCDARPDVAGATDLGETGTTRDMGETGETGDVTTGQPGAQQPDQGRVLVPLEPVRVGALAGPDDTPATGDVEADHTGMSTTTVASSQLQGQQQAFIQIHREDGSPIACGDIDDLSRINLDAGTTGPGTAPGTPGTPAPGGTEQPDYR